MNTHQWYLMGLKKIIVDLSTNTYIGGISASVSSASLLATKLGISVGAISNFTVVGSDIKCKITGSYAIPVTYLLWPSGFSYYDDIDGLVTSTGSIRDYANLIRFNAINSAPISYFGQNCPLLLNAVFPNATAIVDSAFYESKCSLFYIPKATSLGSTTGDNNVFYGASSIDKIIYANPSLSTNNSGNPDGDLQYIQPYATIRYVTNFTSPSAITDLAVGTIYNTAIQLNFTPPSSTNAIDFYEVYVNGVFRNKITGSSGYAMGLTASTYDDITVYVRDVFYNKSLVSNIVSQSTNTTSVIPLTGLVAYYKLEETSGTTAVDSYGGKNLTNSGISINQTGKVLKSYASTANAQKIETTTATPITGNFSVNIWCKRTATCPLYAGIFEYGNYATNSGFSLWTNASGFISWRINQNYDHYSSLIVLPLNVWTMITYTYDGSNVRIYQDGVLKTTTAHTVNPSSNTRTTMFYNAENNAEYLGELDEISTHSIKLTDSNIKLMHNNGAGTTL